MSANTLTAWVDGIGLLAPGLENWNAAAAVLRGEQPYVAAPAVLPAPTLLPPAERRRASRVVKLTLALGLEAAAHGAADVADLTSVFSASTADGHNCMALCETLASDDRAVSPTRFHNSVHNTAAGYWDIATGSTRPTQVLTAYDGSFSAGLLEAAAQLPWSGSPVLLVAYDTEYPDPLRAFRPIPDAGGIALLLGAERSAQSLAKLEIGFTPGSATALQRPELESLRTAIPALLGLPLLDLIARKQAGRVDLEYLAPQVLRIEVTPC